MANNEIENEVVKASDFTVEVKNMPTNMNVRQLKMAMWNWAEYVLEKEKSNEIDLLTK